MARKKNLDEIISAAEKKTGNSVKSRSTNTVQNPTSTTKKDIQDLCCKSPFVMQGYFIISMSN